MDQKTSQLSSKHACHAEMFTTIERDKEEIHKKASWNGSTNMLYLFENGVLVDTISGSKGLAIFIEMISTTIN